MSDGEAMYPWEAIQLITGDKMIMEKLDFIAIGYGSSNFESSLGKIATALNGKLKTCLQP